MELKIDVRQLLRSKLGAKSDRLPAFAVNWLINKVHQDEINDILARYNDLDGVDFMRALVEDYFQVRLKVIGEENLPLPEDGKRYIFASNHPLGGFDGICLSYLLGKRFNGKIRCPVNDLLLYIPNLQSIFLPVNKHGKQTRETVIATQEAYMSDCQILTFPAGLCSRRIKGVIRDLEWQKSFIQKAIAYHRDVVPIYFEGQNSNFFYRLANIRKRLHIKSNIEMLFLPDELFKQKNRAFSVTVGKPIEWQTFERDLRPVQWAERVKETVYKLKEG